MTLVSKMDYIGKDVAASSVSLDDLEIRTPEDGGTGKYVSVYERTSIISMRARHLESGARGLLKDVVTDNILAIAAEEYRTGLIDDLFYVVRQSANGGLYRVMLRDLDKNL